MLFVQFYLDEFRYMLSISDVVEMVPGVKLTPVPKVPEYIPGLCNYRGCSVPVVDLCSLFLERPCNKKLSTRIIFIEATEETGTIRTIGLLVEKATEMIKAEEESFMDAGIYGNDMPFVGPVMADKAGLIARILPDEIFSQIDRELLFPTE